MARRYPEIEKILTGNVVRDRYEVMYPAENQGVMRPNLEFKGSFNGAASVRLHGLSIRYQEFTLGKNTKAGMEQCSRILSQMGSPVRVQKPEQCECVLVWRLMLNPVLLALEFHGRKVRLTAFTARQPLGQFACVRTLKKFYKQLEGILEPGKGDRLPYRDTDADTAAEKKARKAEKAAEKAAAKAEKLKQRAAAAAPAGKTEQKPETESAGAEGPAEETAKPEKEGEV